MALVGDPEDRADPVGLVDPEDRADPVGRAAQGDRVDPGDQAAARSRLPSEVLLPWAPGFPSPVFAP